MNNASDWLTDLSVLALTGFFDRLFGLPLGLCALTAQDPDGRIRMAMTIFTLGELSQAALLEVGVGNWNRASVIAFLKRVSLVLREHCMEVNSLDAIGDLEVGKESEVTFDEIEFEERPLRASWGEREDGFTVTWLGEAGA